MNRSSFWVVILPLCAFTVGAAPPPNLLLIITDDQSWEHAGCYGDKAVRTPAMDRLAENGVRFEHAYCAAPSCSPSRAAILTGQDIYQLEEGGVLTGFLRRKHSVFPQILKQNGYRIGHTGKPYAPITKNVDGAHAAPLGKSYSVRAKNPPQGVSRTDYAASFEQFLESTPEDHPFLFWVGTSEPHLPHAPGRGSSTGIDAANIRVPAFYPDKAPIRESLADYLAEIEWADGMLARIMKTLDRRGITGETLVIFTSDNGMPFPRAKATLYDHGVRMPLIVSWAGRIKPGRIVEDPVSLIDLAPTFLELAGLEPAPMMTGRSLKKLLFARESGVLDPDREFVVSAFEKHTLARPGLVGFPRRALHTKDWTYIVNYEPDRYPAGREDTLLPGWDIYGDIDPSGIKSFFLAKARFPDQQRLFELSFGKVPREELFRKKDDPDMVNNLAMNPNFENVLKTFRGQLNAYLKQTKDPRAQGLSPWDDYNYDRPFPVPNPDFKGNR